MPRWRFWKRDNSPPTTQPVGSSAPPPVAPNARGFQSPPPRDQPSSNLNADGDDKLARLRRRRDAVLFDVEQAESAAAPENPWQERIALLDEALAAVEHDRNALAALPVRPGIPLPPTPITNIEATGETPASVSFSVGHETFRFTEDVDWAERGTQLVRPELVQRTGDAAALVPSSIADERREELRQHLDGSLFVFATDLRDRVLNARPMPEMPTLADLARPCHDCGGWQDWHGTCAECQRRSWRRQQLDAEKERLGREREREEDERARIADRLPIARRRLAEVDAEIAALGGQGHER